MRIRDPNKQLAIRRKALQMIVSEGLNGFSMQKLAKACGVSPATLYIYFKNREDLIMQLCIEAGEKMMDITLKNFEPSMSFSEGLKVQWNNRIKYCLKHPEQMHFLEQLRHSPLYESAFAVISNNFKNVMKDFVTHSVKRNELISVPVEVYWSVAFAPLYNLVKFHMSGKSIGGRKFVLTGKVISNTLELVIKALTP